MPDKFKIPLSILVAGLAIAGGLVISKLQNPKPVSEVTPESLSTVPLLSAGDHYLGNPKASVVIVEYSDYDCPFCASYFSNMKKILEELGKGGRLVWIHRHMPLYQIHETAREKAQITECVADVGGEEKFWEVSELLYKNTLSKTVASPDEIALEAKLPSDKFTECIESEKYLSKVLAEYDEAYLAGARGTPFTVIIKGDERVKLEESLAYFELRSLVESFLNE